MSTQHTESTHHDHHKESFITKYIFSQDHKMIAKQYLFTAIIMGLVGGLLSSLFRVQLAWPDANIPFLGNIDANLFMGLVTIHGTIMVFFVLTGGLSGTFSNFLIPLQCGARDMASPFINMLSYHLFFLSSVVMLSSLFVEAGPAAVGWTVYPPLSALPQAMPGAGLGMTLWLFSMVLFIFSSLMGSLNYIATILNMRTKGMSMYRLPLTIWAFLLTAILGVLTFPVLFGASILLLFDRSLGTSFYLSDIYIAGEALAQTGGSPILWQHLFWFLGHPEVYIVILPALGITSQVIATMARKPIFGYKAMVYSLIAIAILSFLVWGHHMFITGMNPFLGSVFMIVTLIIAVPSAIKVFNYLGTLWRGNIIFSPGMLFAIGLVSLFISGGLTGIFLGNAAIDIPLHNTYFVVAHFHIVMGSAAIFGMFAGIYHWFPKMYGRMMNETLGQLHFWLTFIALYLVFFPMHFMGLAGVPRRYYAFTEFELFNVWLDLNMFISTAAIIGFLAQMLFVYNYFNSMYKGKVAKRNPWRSNTLEWTVPLKPGHGNWPGEIPPVYRWPYDYSRPDVDKDFLPQTISDEHLRVGVDYDNDDYYPVPPEHGHHPEKEVVEADDNNKDKNA